MNVAVELLGASQEDPHSELASLVDSDRYPFLDLDAPDGQALLARCRQQLHETGACVLENFLRRQAIETALAETLPDLDQAYYCENSHNPYLIADDGAFLDDHPRNRRQVSDVGVLADDQIAPGTVLKRLYLWDRLQALVAALLEVPALFPYEDPLGSINLNVFRSGQQLGWHYDNADWVVTLMLQPATVAGAYEYVPWTRDANNENYEAVRDVLDGESDQVKTLAMGAGSLILFRGRHSLHRVTPVEGQQPRLVAVFSYDTQPGRQLTEYTRRLFFGRAS